MSITMSWGAETMIWKKRAYICGANILCAHAKTVCPDTINCMNLIYVQLNEQEIKNMSGTWLEQIPHTKWIFTSVEIDTSHWQILNCDMHDYFC